MADKWYLFTKDLDAGGGWKIDLWFHQEKNLVREVKTHSSLLDEERCSTFPYVDFDPEVYGAAGEEFIDAVELLLRQIEAAKKEAKNDK